MRELSIPAQRGFVIAAFGLLFAALVIQPIYVLVNSVWPHAGQTARFIPASCFVLVTLSVICSVWVEQSTGEDNIRDCALLQIRIVLVLVVAGIFSASQASSWWRIEGEWFAGLVNVAVVPFLGAILVFTAVGCRQAWLLSPDQTANTAPSKPGADQSPPLAEAPEN
jgi:hypothetical protein